MRNTTATASTRPQERSRLLLYGALAILVITVYGQACRFEFLNMDDVRYVTENPHVQAPWSWNGFAWAFTTHDFFNWHPLTWLSHMLDWQLFGRNPAGHHVVNVLLHLVNTWLLFALLARATNTVWPSALAAALFAVHPLHVESVAWVAERKDVLSTGFALLALLSYTAYTRRSRARWYAAALLFFLLGLMAKSMVMTLPILLLLLDYWPLQRLNPVGNARRLRLRLVFEKIPFFILAAAGGILAMQAMAPGRRTFSLEQRLANALVAYVMYIGKMVWPAHLAVFYPHLGPRLAAWQILAAGVMLASITVAVCLWRRRCPYLIVGWLWYLITLAPASGIVQIGAHGMADRYTYVPLIGLFIMAAWGAADLVKTLRIPRYAAAAGGVAVTVAFAAAAFVQTGYWRNDVTLFEHALAVTTDNAVAHTNLGFAIERAGRIDEAARHYQEAIRIDPQFDLAHIDLGCLRLNQGKLDEAIAHLDQALKIDPANALAHVNLGHALLRRNRPEDASAQYECALATEPNNAQALIGLGNALARLGKTGEAIAHYEQALERAPDSALAHNNLGYELAHIGKQTDAAAHYEAALRTDPGFALAHNNYGNLLLDQDKIAEAKGHFERVIADHPADPNAHYNLGNALLKEGRLDDAIRAYTQAIQNNPEEPAAYNNLGFTLTKVNRVQDAITAYQNALRLNPRFALAHDNLGVALAQLGRTNEALAHFSEALKIDPHFARARAHLEALKAR